MGKKVYDVPLVMQQSSPICWIACATMISSWKSGQTQGIGAMTGGYDPNSASIPNVSTTMIEEGRLRRLGFTLERSESPSAEYIERLLNRGPFILLHFMAGFPYHFGRAFTIPPGATHAIVITGIDTAGFEGKGRCWFNNPWGTKNSSCYIEDVVTAMKKWPSPYNQAAYLP